MPQYKKTQYGLKQYGLFLPKDPSKKSRHYRFVKARFGVVKKGKTYWLYQHSFVTLKGEPTRLRLKTNLNEVICEEKIFIKRNFSSLRIKGNKESDWIINSNTQQKGKEK